MVDAQLTYSQIHKMLNVIDIFQKCFSKQPKLSVSGEGRTTRVTTKDKEYYILI